MDSTQTARSSPPRLEDLARRTARTLLLPYIVSYISTHGPSDQPQEVAVIVNPRTGSLTMIDGGIDGTPMLGKEGLVPASKESIDAMPMIEVGEQGFDCAICLSEFEIGEEAKQMPCKHKYHAGCIDKWLGIQGSCPVCRYRMPVEGLEEEKKEGGAEESAAAEEEEEEEDEEEVEGEEEEEEEGEEEGEGVLGLTRIPTFVFHIYFAGRNRTVRNSGSEPRETNGGSEPNESEEEEGEEESGEEANEYEASESEDEESDGSAEDMEVDSGSASYEMDMDIDRNVTS